MRRRPFVAVDRAGADVQETVQILKFSRPFQYLNRTHHVYVENAVWPFTLGITDDAILAYVWVRSKSCAMNNACNLVLLDLAGPCLGFQNIRFHPANLMSNRGKECPGYLVGCGSIEYDNLLLRVALNPVVSEVAHDETIAAGDENSHWLARRIAAVDEQVGAGHERGVVAGQ